MAAATTRSGTRDTLSIPGTPKNAKNKYCPIETPRQGTSKLARPLAGTASSIQCHVEKTPVLKIGEAAALA